MKPPDHRCPECHATFLGKHALDAHRETAQGDCFHNLLSKQRRRILRYRAEFNITPPPLPDDPYADGVIE